MNRKKIQDEIFKIRFWISNVKDNINNINKGLVNIEKSITLKDASMIPLLQTEELPKCTLKEFKYDNISTSSEAI